MKRILLASVTCFLLTLSAFAQERIEPPIKNWDKFEPLGAANGVAVFVNHKEATLKKSSITFELLMAEITEQGGLNALNFLVRTFTAECTDHSYKKVSEKGVLMGVPTQNVFKDPAKEKAEKDSVIDLAITKVCSKTLGLSA